MLKHTKIIATISDLRCDVDFLRTLYEAGMNVARLNTAHLSVEGLSRVVNNLRAVSGRIGILMDTKGPEIRTTPSAAPIAFHAGDRVCMAGRPDEMTTRKCICVSYEKIAEDMPVGGDILIDDGDLELHVVAKENGVLVCDVLNDATLGSHKSVNLPGVPVCLPSLTDKDRENIRWAIAHQLDFIAHSFVRSKQDILDVQQLLDERQN